MAKHYRIVPATYGLDRAFEGPGVRLVFPPEAEKAMKQMKITRALDAAFEAGRQSVLDQASPQHHGAGSPGDGTHDAAR